MGVDIAGLLDRAGEMADACRLDGGNPGLELGLELGEAWQEGRDKVCLPDAGVFGLWVEQLLAESTGKQGRGLVPAPGESADGPDRQRHALELDDPYDLGREFFRWELATAVAGTILAIDPFDQPDVQAAKDRTNEVLASGDPELEPCSSPAELYELAAPGDYVCIQAFIEPGPTADATIAELVAEARAETGCVVTHGYGPRYLHSTGQLHKGGPNTGLFLQVVEDYGPELPIPGRDFGFARLIRAQAAGDFAALRERGRRLARIVVEETG
jgi:glucose-6-phosphate isomerase/transaldolase/glucose-6-phosphate isomerase